MGYSSVSDMRNFVAEDTALTWHLQSNHYPPISVAFLPMAKAALAHARAGEWEATVEFPAGARRAGQSVAISEVVKELHLEAFLEEEGE